MGFGKIRSMLNRLTGPYKMAKLMDIKASICI
jgi:hypothetical protein